MKLSPVNNENGAVLITGLLILLVLTLIGISGMNNSTLEEVMSRNQASRNIAFQAAEAALREGEDYLDGATLPDFPGTYQNLVASGLYKETTGIDILDYLNWNTSDSVAYSGTISSAVEAPRYVIEELVVVEGEGNDSLVAGTEVSERQMYRVTARGVGTRSNAVVVLQSTFLR